MTTVHNLGSINVDIVYRVPHIPQPGETLASTDRNEGLGGKGANMSIALAAAGATVRHYGAVGADGAWTVEALRARGVDCDGVRTIAGPTGHALIQVDTAGENAITIFAGANQDMPLAIVEDIMSAARPGDWLLLQNETAHGPEAVARARAAGLRIAYAAAPFDAALAEAMAADVDLLALNEVEAAQMAAATGKDIGALGVPMVLVTKGAAGATVFVAGGAPVEQAAFPVDTVIDTTGAGDTFLGYFLGGLAAGATPGAALRRASMAGALAVTGAGAADAIPAGDVVDAALARA